MAEPTVFDWVTTISSIVTPLMLLILSYLFTKISKTQENIQNLQEKLHADRIAIYNAILEPYIIIATPDAILKKQKKYQHLNKGSGDIAAEIITTPEYKQSEFKLFMIGSDSVVKAYNSLKKYYYSEKLDGTIETTKEALTLVAKLVLEIRKSVGNENTKLSHLDAIWWFVKDADKVFNA
jgi:hypothetical protein